MITIKDLINKFDIKDMAYQFLTGGSVDFSIKGKKNDKHLQIKFCTRPEYIVGKEAIIIWVDKDKFKTVADSLLEADNSEVGP